MQVGDLVISGEYGTVGIILKMDERNAVLIAPTEGENHIWYHRSELKIVKADKKCP